MLDRSIPAKTDAGRLEIEQRTLRLGARQRTVLISINGERTLGEIRRQFESIGNVDAMIGELADAGLIEITGATPAANAADVSVPESAPAAATAVPDELAPLPAARKYMNDTVVSHLGLRAFLFSLRIEKCYSKRELFELLPEFRRQLRKVVDNDRVNACHEEAEALIARI
ncbi:hypothetical protein ACQQ2N_05865 [Dokdonella sp. MW10]|uniref:hypothetical protein n=1 Tax=Dokdonella sp. MW10 TaxID=2992926 RepID=UPI003F7E9AC9